MPTLKDLKDQIARAAFGMTPAEAWTRGVCIRCQHPVPTDSSPEDRREYRISALCPACYDRLSAPRVETGEDGGA